MLAQLWEHTTDFLNTGVLTVGNTIVTVSGLIRVLVVLVIAWWVSKLIRIGLSRIALRWPGMNKASIYTIGRVFHYSVMVLGLMIGLSTLGIDLTNFALLLGALGVGLGFGLQSMVSNFISGLIILFEKSLKVGDFVELESGVTGEVREINIRSTRITTNDNIDILVPNSEFVNGRVINWTLDEAYRRIHVPFGVAYGTDKENVRAAVLEAADRVPYTLKGVSGREPQVWFVRFGDSSLDFELVVWLVQEAVKRPGRVQAAYLWEIHTALYQHGIEIPFPQRDLHVRSLLGLKEEEARKWLEKKPKNPSP
jgi:potassium-dependent mechanosensitive channel